MNRRVLLLAPGLLAAALLPEYLPGTVVALRERIFTWVNGDEGVAVVEEPNGTRDFLDLYGSPAAAGRSAGAGLSDLFWYWLAPGPHVHQEHLEPGPRYDDAARTTRTVLASRTKAEWNSLVSRCAERVLTEVTAAGRTVRLRDVAMPIWAEVYFELVFGEPCPRPVRTLIVDNAEDVVGALKCTRLRHMRRRARLTRYLRGRIAVGSVGFALPASLSPEEQAFYLQGAFFNTAVVQMSEASAHLLLALAQHPDEQDALREDPGDAAQFDRVADETMRLYPLFGIAHRITTADIARPGGEPAVPAGSVLLFEYAAYQRAGVGDADRFDPSRWTDRATRPPHFIPYGVSANRPCPARGVAPIGLQALTAVVLARYRLASSAVHTRSLPNRGPVLLSAVEDRAPHRARLLAMRVGDHWAEVPRSVVQLVLGSFMVWDARRQALCRNYFTEHPEHRPASKVTS